VKERKRERGREKEREYEIQRELQLAAKDDKGHTRPRRLLTEEARVTLSPAADAGSCAVDETIILSSPAGKKCMINLMIKIRGIMPHNVITMN
jgi:hypothetical protein